MTSDSELFEKLGKIIYEELEFLAEQLQKAEGSATESDDGFSAKEKAAFDRAKVLILSLEKGFSKMKGLFLKMY